MGEHEEEHVIASDILEKKSGVRIEKKEEKKEGKEPEKRAEGMEGKKGTEGAPVVKLTINIVLLSFAVFGMLAAIALYFIVDNVLDQGKLMVMSRLETITKSIGDTRAGVEKMADAISRIGNASEKFGNSIGKSEVGFRTSGEEVKSFGNKIKTVNFGGVISFKEEGEELEKAGEELIKSADELKEAREGMEETAESIKSVKQNFEKVKKDLEDMEASIQNMSAEIEGIFSALKTANCLASGIFFLMFAVLLLSASKDFIHF
jgi:hypothetical protein